MLNELNTHVLRAGAPSPSVETLLHAILPHKYVDHTHADAVLAISNAPDGEKRIREIYGERVAVMPYVMAGFSLAAHCAREFPKQASGKTIGMVLVSHGIFSFGAEARGVVRAHDRAGLHGRGIPAEEESLAHRSRRRSQRQPAKREEIASLRRAISEQAGFPVMLKIKQNEKFLRLRAASEGGGAVAERPGDARPPAVHQADADARARRGRPMRALPRLLRAACRQGAEDHARSGAARGARSAARLRRCGPRRARGGASSRSCTTTRIDVILRAEALGGWRGVGENHMFDIEYWDLEQAKRGRPAAPPMFRGEVALVTGAASGIGKACADAFLRRGAAVVGLDRNPAIASLWQRPDFLGLAVRPDRRRRRWTRRSSQAVTRFGGRRHAGPERRHLPQVRAAAEHRRRRLAADHERQRRGAAAPPAALPSPAPPRAARRPHRGDRLAQRARAGARRGGLLRFQGRAQPGGARRGARMGEGRHPHQLAAPGRGLRHRACGPRSCSPRAPRPTT